MKHFFYAALMLVITVLFSCAGHGSRDNERIARSFIEAWTVHDVNKLISLFHDECSYWDWASFEKGLGVN